MFARRDAKRLERLNVTEVYGFVIGGVEGELDVDASSPGVNTALYLVYVSARQR